MGNNNVGVKSPDEFHPQLLRKSSSLIFNPSNEYFKNISKFNISYLGLIQIMKSFVLKFFIYHDKNNYYFKLKEGGSAKLEEILESMSQRDFEKYNSINLDFYLRYCDFKSI